MKEPLEDVPSATVTDKVFAVAVAAVGGVPVVGSGFSEVIRQVFGTPLERRHHAWLDKLGEALADVERLSTNYEDAVARPGFVSAVVEASSIAIGEHLEEKLDMLKAVLVGAALRPDCRETDLSALRFLRWVDQLEPEHIVILLRVRLRSPSASPSSDEQKVLDDYSVLRETAGMDLPLMMHELTTLGLLLDGANGGAIFDMTSRTRRAVQNSGSGPEPHDELSLLEAADEFLRWLEVV